MRKRAELTLARSESRFKLLSETSSRLLATQNPQGIVEELCLRVMEHLDCQAFFSFLADERAGKLRLNAYSGVPEEEARRIEWLDYGAAVTSLLSLRKEMRRNPQHLRIISFHAINGRPLPDPF